MGVDWEDIRMVWQTGVGSLTDKSKEYGVSLPEIMLHAKKELWGTRAAEADFASDAPDLQYDSMARSYRKTILRVKKLSDAIIESLKFETNTEVKLDALEKVAKIIGKLMPLGLEVAEAGEEGDLTTEDIIKMVKQQQMKALKKGDIKMLTFLGKQYLGQKDELDLFIKEITPGMSPKEAASIYKDMISE